MSHDFSTICPHDDASDQDFAWHYCEICEEFVWRAQEYGEIYFIPFIDKKEVLGGGLRKIITKAKNENECDKSILQFPIRTRLNLDLDYIDGNLPLGEIKKNTQFYFNNRLSEISERVKPFGLKVTRLISEGELEKHEPLLIHRIHENPMDLIPEFKEATDSIIIPIPKKTDSRWSVWERKIQSELFFGEKLFTPQKNSLIKILKNPRSFTMVGLPTGFGKTRIAQVATTLLRRTEGGDNGPTLIISPLISLMDDQRRCWNQILNDALEIEGKHKLNCKFLTSSVDHKLNKKEIMGELLNDKIDVLCCSPESLLTPRIGKSKDWIEIFQEMKNPFSLMVIDEVHTIADWGASIRPEFQLLDTIKRTIIRRNPNLRVLLMSATITKREDKELRRMFDVSNTMRDTGAIIREPDDSACATRNDLMFDFNTIKVENLQDEITNINHINKYIILQNDWRFDSKKESYNKNIGPSSSVIFTRKRVDAIGILKKTFENFLDVHKVCTYTGATNNDLRQKILTQFIDDEMDYLIATSAFGMGVDKKNVWLSAYLGQPYSIKGLYQAFGRAARDSDWKTNNVNKRSGICIGRFYGKNMPFKPSMQIKLSMERLYDLLTKNRFNKKISNTGYMLLDLTDNPNSGFTTNLNDDSELVQNFFMEDDTNQDEFDIQDIIKSSIDIINKNILSREKNQEEIQRRRYHSIDSHIKLRLWVISCLERTNSISIVGTHPEIVGIDDNGDEIHLVDLISKSKSYHNSIESISKLNNYPHKQNRLMVIRFNKSIKDFSDFKSEMELGINLLKKNHDNGIKELNDFINYIDKDKGCIRKILAVSVGRTMDEEATCMESIREKKQPVMPCSFCRKDQWFIDKLLPQNGPLISTKKIMNLLTNHKKIGKEITLKYFRIIDYGNIYCFEKNMEYRILEEENKDNLPNNGNYDLIRDGKEIGKINLSNSYVKFLECSEIITNYNDYYFEKVNKKKIEMRES